MIPHSPSKKRPHHCYVFYHNQKINNRFDEKALSSVSEAATTKISSNKAPLFFDKEINLGDVGTVKLAIHFFKQC